MSSSSCLLLLSGTDIEGIDGLEWCPPYTCTTLTRYRNITLPDTDKEIELDSGGNLECRPP